MKRNLMKTSGKYWIMCLLLLLSGCSASRATMPKEPFTFDSIVCSAENTIGKYEGHNGYTALDLLLEVDPTAKYTGTGELLLSLLSAERPQIMLSMSFGPYMRMVNSLMSVLAPWKQRIICILNGSWKDTNVFVLQEFLRDSIYFPIYS